MDEIKTQMTKMLKQGIIQLSTSPWHRRVCIMQKKFDVARKAKWRVIIDSRKLHEVIVDHKYPLRKISE